MPLDVSVRKRPWEWSFPTRGVVAEWLNAAVLKGDPPLSHRVRFSPSLPRSVSRPLTPLSGCVRQNPMPGAQSPHKTPHLKRG
jgi:hypothetical protein